MIVNRNGLSDPTWPVNPVIRGLWPCAIDSTAVCGASSVALVWSVQKSQILMKRKIFTVIIFPPLTGFSFLKANVGGGGGRRLPRDEPGPPVCLVDTNNWWTPQREAVRKKVCSRRCSASRSSTFPSRGMDCQPFSCTYFGDTSPGVITRACQRMDWIV